MTKEENDYVLGLIKKALLVTSDEREGTQTVDLSEINLCSIDYTDFTGYKDADNNYITETGSISDSDSSRTNSEKFVNGNLFPGFGGMLDTGNKANMTPELIKLMLFNEDILDILTCKPEDMSKVLSEMNSDVKVIIEFAQPSLFDLEEIEYSLTVKPSQEISEDTIIGYIKLNGLLRTIKSMFSSGKVLANEEGTDFLKLYPSECNRHIILDEVQYGTNIGIDTSVLEKSVEEFQQESTLYDLITTHIALSILPNILLNRYSRDDTIADGFLARLALMDTGQEIFNRAKKELDKINKEYSEDLKDLASEKRIKATKGNTKKIKDVGNTIINRRQQRLDDIIELYNKRNDFEKCEYDPYYADCQMLALGIKREKLVKTGEVKVHDVGFEIDDEDFKNYYLYLYSLLNLQEDDPNNSFIHHREYAEILKNIIYLRMFYEGFDMDALEKDFEQLYKDIMPKKYRYSDVLKVLSKQFPEEQVTYNQIYDWLGERVNNREEEAVGLQLMSNIYLFIRDLRNNELSIKEVLLTKIISRRQESDAYKLFSKHNFNISKIELEFIERYDKHIDKEKLKELPLRNKNTWNFLKIYIPDTELTYRHIYELFDKYTKNDTLESDKKDLALIYLYIRLYSKNKKDVTKTLEDWYFDNSDILELVKDECQLLEEFWKKILDEYEDKKLDKVKLKFEDVALSLNKYAIWPLQTEFYVNGVNYKHYLFSNIKFNDGEDDEDQEIIDIDANMKWPEIPQDWPAPINPLLEHDMSDIEADVKFNEITYKDYKYWLRYFSLATIICLLPMYWNCGLDILPYIQNFPLPCIFICINAVYIQWFDLVIVFGIAIRGMYISPIVLYVNASDQYASIMTPLIGIVKNLLQLLNAKIEKLEWVPILSIANTFIKKLEKENETLLKEIQEYDIYYSEIKSQRVENLQLIKNQFRAIQNKFKKKEKSETNEG